MWWSHHQPYMKLIIALEPLWTAQLGKAFIWAFLFRISLISLSFSSFGCFCWFLILFSLGSGQQVKRPSAFQGWLPIIPQWWKLSESMGMLAALVFSAGYWFSSLKARLCGFKAASPAAELEFAVKTWHQWGCTPVMGQCLSCRPIQCLKVFFVLKCFRQGNFFCDHQSVHLLWQCIYLWLDAMHGCTKAKRGRMQQCKCVQCSLL